MDNVLITGANSDIGKSLIERLEAKNIRVIATARSTSSQDADSRARILDGIDLTDGQCLELLRQAVIGEFASPFSWVHCVGDFWLHKPLEKTSIEEAKSMVLSHYLTLFATAQIVLPLMKKVGGGQLLAFSCNSVRYNYPDMAAFTSAKAAVECFVKCISNEYIEHNIAANCFALPTIKTEKVVRTKHSDYHDHYISSGELADVVIEHLSQAQRFCSGNALSLVKHSPYFYTEGYYRRNRSL